MEAVLLSPDDKAFNARTFALAFGVQEEEIESIFKRKFGERVLYLLKDDQIYCSLPETLPLSSKVARRFGISDWRTAQQVEEKGFSVKSSLFAQPS